MPRKRLLKLVMLALWLPVLWGSSVLIHVIARPSLGYGYFARAYDQLIYFSCFLLYPIRALKWSFLEGSLIPFGVQFLFWWGVSFAATLALALLAPPQAP